MGLLGSPGYIGGFFISGKPHVEKQSVFVSHAISGLVLTSYGQCTLVWSRTRALTAHVNVTKYRCCCKVQARVESHNALSLVPGTTPGKEKQRVVYLNRVLAELRHACLFVGKLRFVTEVDPFMRGHVQLSLSNVRSLGSVVLVCGYRKLQTIDAKGADSQ